MLLWLWTLGIWGDSLRIAPHKKLRPYELARKREGWVSVGYPGIDYDALRGVGVSAVASIAYEGSKQDPTYEYEPYQHYFFFQGGLYQHDSRFFRFLYDAPWLGNRPYRVSLRLSHRQESQGQFWGLGESFLRCFLKEPLPLFERELKRPRWNPQGYWETALGLHHFYISHWQVWLSGERIAMQGLLRIIGGIRWIDEKVLSLRGRTYWLRTPDGRKVKAVQLPTMLDSAAEGYQLYPPPAYFAVRKWRSRLFVGGALVWDSRDFEIDPTRGWMIEVGHESLIPYLSTHKSYFSVRQYATLLRGKSETFRVLGAWHFLCSTTHGSRVFFTDYYTYNRWSDGQNLALLSGTSTLRAFRENRFVTAIAYLLQYELRMRVAEVRIWRQHFIGGPLFFADVATGTDRLRVPRYFVWGLGTGARILWNMTTVLRVDAAWGREGWQIHFHTGHTF
ncbi:MAG: outer membrane protein assembly factor [Bacteroidia bacterium]|nr:outer membrane protein assembly factor [Bacteroidia bacterium]MDW8236280.1 DUF5982 domain-containing protein [Bacteroidia bacterium]